MPLRDAAIKKIRKQRAVKIDVQNLTETGHDNLLHDAARRPEHKIHDMRVLPGMLGKGDKATRWIAASPFSELGNDQDLRQVSCRQPPAGTSGAREAPRVTR